MTDDTEKKTEKAEKTKKAVKKYSKKQFLKSEGYKANRDLLATILEKDKKYSRNEVETLIKKYMKGKVN